MNDRKAKPLFRGCLMYFPDALLAISEHSRKANEKHNPGEEMHWSKGKSTDHADCIARHLVDIGPNWDATDPELNSYHATALAWRALALLQTLLERKQAEYCPTSDELLDEIRAANARLDDAANSICGVAGSISNAAAHARAP